MAGAHDESDVAISDRLLRLVVAALGGGAVGLGGLAVSSVVPYLAREPRSPAEAHAMAHSAVGVVLVIVVGATLAVAGGIMLAVAYVNRRRLSAGTLLAVGALGLLLFRGPFTAPAIFVAVAGAAGIVGGVALVEELQR